MSQDQKKRYNSKEVLLKAKERKLKSKKPPVDLRRRVNQSVDSDSSSSSSDTDTISSDDSDPEDSDNPILLHLYSAKSKHQLGYDYLPSIRQYLGNGDLC